jgi:hypothetical protein
MTYGEDGTNDRPSGDQLAHFAPFVQRLQRDPQFQALIDEFTEARRDRPLPEAQADFVRRLQQEPHFLALVEEFTGGRPEQPVREAPAGPPSTSGWPTEETVIAGPKAAAAAVAAAALGAGG